MSRKSFSVAALAVAGMAAGAAQAQIAVRDAETGQLRAPTAAEAAALRSSAPGAAAITAAPTAAVQRAVQGGGVALKLDDSHMVYSVARVNANGVVERECVSGSESAAKAMQKRPAFAKPMSMVTSTRGAAYELK